MIFKYPEYVFLRQTTILKVFIANAEVILRLARTGSKNCDERTYVVHRMFLAATKFALDRRFQV